METLTFPHQVALALVIAVVHTGRQRTVIPRPPLLAETSALFTSAS